MTEHINLSVYPVIITVDCLLVTLQLSSSSFCLLCIFVCVRVHASTCVCMHPCVCACVCVCVTSDMSSSQTFEVTYKHKTSLKKLLG